LVQKKECWNPWWVSPNGTHKKTENPKRNQRTKETEKRRRETRAEPAQEIVLKFSMKLEQLAVLVQSEVVVL